MMTAVSVVDDEPFEDDTNDDDDFPFMDDSQSDVILFLHMSPGSHSSPIIHPSGRMDASPGSS
jgi:hypothetical protein